MRVSRKWRFWVQWRSWALPIRIGALGYVAQFEVQIGPFGATLERHYHDL